MSGVIHEIEDKYCLDFKFNPHTVEAIKRIPGRRFDGSSKTWYVPKSSIPDIASFAKRHQLTMASRDQRPENYSEIPPMPELTIEVDSYIYSKAKKAKGEGCYMRHYQKSGVAYALNAKRVLIADPPGLGKTITAISTIIIADSFPCLVIAPTTLKENWKREIEDWTGKKALILSDSCKNNFQRYHAAGYADFYIVNLESLKKYFIDHIDKGKRGMMLKDIHFKENINFFKSVIIDEFHRCKSNKSQQSKFTKGIALGKEYILGLTGTPVVNKPIDLWPELHILNRLNDFGGYKGFIARYCSGPREASNLKELNYRLNTTCFYRREKSDVLKELPAKTRQVVSCDISTRKEYTDAEVDLENYLRQYKGRTEEEIDKSMRGEIMVRIGHLKRISAKGKHTSVVEFIKDIMESGEKLVVFAHHSEVIDKVTADFPDSVKITGDMHPKLRQISIDTFQNDDNCKLIVCSIKAAGVGLTLTASSRVAFIELPWHPADCEQCEDRTHRIGQHDNVTCTYFLGKDTIDEWVYSIIDNKRSITNEITGASDDVETDIIDQVWNLFNQKKEK